MAFYIDVVCSGILSNTRQLQSVLPAVLCGPVHSPSAEASGGQNEEGERFLLPWAQD